MVMRFYKPTLRRKDMDAVLQAMVDERIGPGERVDLFVQDLKTYLRCDGACVALRTGTDAITIALQAADVKAGSTIGISALSPSYYASAITGMGCTFSIGDISSDGILSEDEALRLQDEGSDAILLYEPSGSMCRNGSYEHVRIPIIEDITESIGSVFSSQERIPVGSAMICAFEEDNIVSTGGGAAIISVDKTYSESLDTLMNTRKDRTIIEMADLNAALGIIQLMLLPRHIERRRAIYEQYRQAQLRNRHALFGISDIDFEPNGSAFTIILESKLEDIVQFAHKYEVPVKPAFRNAVIAIDTEEFQKFPNAMPCILRAVSFPIYPFLPNQHVSQVERVIAHAP